ncbi:hypothetical protein CHS0354_001489 [Potamilus streckersoni]|uniref:Uncharacterized protein n=1 Tax=Potamilus streckersoni TaxID=2493646 RepID=A0AAE0RVH1_9BIVA|nr:hypothetical protein CHS0354_001489 [Potamilus streckersoni]
MPQKMCHSDFLPLQNMVLKSSSYINCPARYFYNCFPSSLLHSDKFFIINMAASLHASPIHMNSTSQVAYAFFSATTYASCSISFYVVFHITILSSNNHSHMMWILRARYLY